MASKFIIEGLKELRDLADGYKGAPKLIHDLLLKTCYKFAADSKQTSMNKYLSGGPPDVLGAVSGRLRSSIQTEVVDDGDSITISMGTGVPYGPIHEYGGPILRKGKVVGRMRKRSFIRRAYEENMGNFTDNIATLIQGAAEGGWKRGV